MKIGEVWKNKYTKESVKIMKISKHPILSERTVVFSYINDSDSVKAWTKTAFIDNFKKL